MGIVITSKITAFLYESDTKKIISVQEYKNTLTNTFMNRIAQWLGGANNTGANAVLGASKFQMGTGSGTPAASDTSLFTPVASSLINIAGANVSGNSVSYIINYPANTTSGTFTEAGLLDANNVLLTHLMLNPNISIAGNLAVTLQYTLNVTTQ
jgi:hypothetical protein